MPAAGPSPTDTATSPASWTVVLPVKVLASAKSRMATSAPGSSELAFAFFLDTLAAVQSSPAVAEIIVATSDDRVADAARSAGSLVVADAGHPGINAAASWAAGQRVGTGGVAIVVSDLPCLTPESLTSVLDAASGHPTAFLADADGSGTTMWFAGPGTRVDPHFGHESREAHRRAGDVDISATHPEGDDAWRPARRDVDTEDALRDAHALGLGAATSRVLDRTVGRAGGGSGDRIVTVVSRHGQTIEVVDETGRTAELAWAPVADAGLRDVHPGQRLVVTNGPEAQPATVRVP